jgi:DNA repair exonuclease SbcCD nuclease subunit
MATRLVDFADALDEVLRVAEENEVDLVVDTGDTFDSPNPGPYSIGAMRRFAESLQRKGIKFLGITGNHNNHSESMLFEKGNWMSAISDFVIRPKDPSSPLRISSKNHEHEIDVVCADWMPREHIDNFVSRIPFVVDALFMHQSCEGFISVIGRPELYLAQIDGKARYAGIGDIHVTKKQETPLGTVVGSAGSTELVRTGEPQQKYVVLVTFGNDKEEPPKWQPIEIHTRRVINFPCINTEADIELFREQIATALPSCGEKKPMLVCSYLRSMSKRMDAFETSIKDLGITLIRFSPEPDVVSSEVVVGETIARSVSMVEVLREVIPDEQVRDLCVLLWENVEMAEALLEQFKQTIIAKYHNESHES